MKHLSALLITCMLFSLLGYAQDAQRPPVWGIAKMTFFITDFKEARDFYGRVLGFGEAFSYASPKGKVISFKVNDRQFLEFIENANAKNIARLVSVSFETEDVEQMRRYLQSRNIEVPATIGIDGAGNEAILINDDSGIPVEFINYTPQSLHRKSKGKFLSENRISTRIHHVGLFTKKVVDDNYFYTGILGCREIWRYPESRDEPVFMNYLQLPDCVENIEHYPYDDVNSSHPCLLVEDMQETIYTLKTRIPGEKLARPIVAKGKRWLLNIRNSDGTKVEFTEAHTIK